MKTVSCRTVASVVGRPEGWDEEWLLYRGKDWPSTHRYRMRWQLGASVGTVEGWALLVEAQVSELDARDFCACDECLAIVCEWVKGVYGEVRERNCEEK